MKQLSRKILSTFAPETIVVPPVDVYSLEEKVLQFGTGVLLRGLPDYFIDKANRSGLFNWRIVVVKSTRSGDASAFAEQDNLYTLCIRGVVAGETIRENRICSAISRVVSADKEWDEVLEFAKVPQLNCIISNTTEVGIQLVEESIFQNPPQSFPGKLLAVLYERFKKLGNGANRLIVLPTELLTDNGKKLEAIVLQLAKHNALEEDFISWTQKHVRFCNTLVDCIVPGRPQGDDLNKLEAELGYEDKLLAVTEEYRLWAIEGDDKVREQLPFAAADPRVVITPDITKFKELKLRLLNGTHTLSCGVAALSGIPTVCEGMADASLSAFIERLMLHEIAPSLPVPVAENEVSAFAHQVLDRFRNPFLQHRWLSITLQYSSKLAQRVVPVLLKHYEQKSESPRLIAFGFAAYLLFMRSEKKPDGTWWGTVNGSSYKITDDQTDFYFQLWQNTSPQMVVQQALQQTGLWGSDLTQLPGFEKCVVHLLQECMHVGVTAALENLLLQKS